MAADKVLNEIWDSWEFHVREDLERLDRKCFLAIQEASALRVPREVSAEYFAQRLSELIEYVANHRETDAQQAQRLAKRCGGPISQGRLSTPQKRLQEAIE